MRCDRSIAPKTRLARGSFLALGLSLALASAVFAPAALALDSSLTPRSTKGADHIQGVPYDGGRIEGDTVADPFIITGWVYTGTGNTCGFTNDYEETCPYGESYSPDVVYEFAPGSSLNLRVDLCSSNYDTKLYVYDFAAGYGFGDPLACNDDACGASGWRSSLDFTSEPGHTYHVVVDGYSNDCGDYMLEIYEIMIEVVECPAGASLEGEPDCHDDYDDLFNGGCNSTPPVFSCLTGTPQGERMDICGKSGTFTYDGFPYRDTDWFQLDVSQPSEITFECVAEFPLGISLLDGNAGCNGVQTLDSGTAYPFEVVTRTRAFDPGTYWFWVGPSVFSGAPCGGDYVLSITGYSSDPSGVPEEGMGRGTTWGAVKRAFH